MALEGCERPNVGSVHPNYCALVSLMNLQVEEEIPRAAALALSGKGFSSSHGCVCSGHVLPAGE